MFGIELVGSFVFEGAMCFVTIVVFNIIVDANFMSSRNSKLLEFNSSRLRLEKNDSITALSLGLLKMRRKLES